MQANTANEHSQMLAQIPANACSDSESRKCPLVLLLVCYSTLVSRSFDCETPREREHRPAQDHVSARST